MGLKRTEIENLKKLNEKNNGIIDSLSKICNCYIEGRTISETLHIAGYRKIVVYGYSKIGRILLNEFERNPKIEIVGVIDQNENIKCDPYRFISCSETEYEADLILVTNEYYYADIKKNLYSSGHSAQIYSVEDILSQM